jgi:hypothetical protein
LLKCTYLAKRLRELSSTKTGSYPHEFLCRTNCSACADYQPWKSKMSFTKRKIDTDIINLWRWSKFWTVELKSSRKRWTKTMVSIKKNVLMNLDLNLNLTQKPFRRLLINIQVIKKENPPIPIDTFYEYFINLNH